MSSIYNKQLQLFKTVAFIGGLLLLISAATTPFGAASAEDKNRYPKGVAVFISREIKPYLQAADALRQQLDQAGQFRIQQFFFDDPEIFYADSVLEQIETGEYDLIVTVGTEASKFAAENRIAAIVPIIYTMLAKPEDIFKNEENVCGVSINVPFETQLHEINRTLPDIHTIGVLLDPKYNARFVGNSTMLGNSMGVSVAPIEVHDKSEISKALRSNWYKMEALWLIPDGTVTSSTSIVKYLIKEAVVRNVPVIVYNRPFYDYGAAMAFIVDYEEIGRQTAEMAIKRLEQSACEREDPIYETAVNQRVLKQIGITTSNNRESGPLLP